MRPHVAKTHGIEGGKESGSFCAGIWLRAGVFTSGAAIQPGEE